MRIPFWYLVLVIRIRVTMCVVGVVIGEPAVACFACVSRMLYGTARRPDRRDTYVRRAIAVREKCHMCDTSHLQPNLT